jgi:hypothetical protein
VNCFGTTVKHPVKVRGRALATASGPKLFVAKNASQKERCLDASRGSGRTNTWTA